MHGIVSRVTMFIVFIDTVQALTGPFSTTYPQYLELPLDLQSIGRDEARAECRQALELRDGGSRFKGALAAFF